MARMLKVVVILSLAILTFPGVYGQKQSIICECPETQFAGTKPDTAFHLSNGKVIVLCGYKIPGSKQSIYSEFVLANCGDDSIIDFWGAALTCRLNVSKDTLFVYQLKNLPTGDNISFQETVWLIEKIYFEGQNLIRNQTVNRYIRKYNQDEILEVLKNYKTAGYGLDENKMQLANKLFIAAISGDKTARQYFKDFKTKFGILGGAFAEEYNDLTAMLELWDEDSDAQ